ncbi:3-oxoacyl-ACP reductase FabG [Geotalea sp. SG265]|uniref:3-oxoacyl-ACP reductase FabG n=1 Tax=Geotalea sp. SG265 TaxID=2922867 RepID=UPI001FAF414D|nr:3-oxoacyl-ACP reductase FabG [Geotalea sp. SG265]
MEFKDKRIVVTGGTRGIGKAISLNFARQGAHVTAAYLANDQAAELLKEEAAGLPGTIATIKADVATGDGAMALMEAAAAATGSIDVLVNNAGIIRDCYLPMMSENDWDTVVRGNLYPLFHCCKWGVRKMIAKRSGVIVNLSSISALGGTAGQTNYAASKGAAISFTRSLAREVGPMGIRANVVAPGLIETEMIAAMKPDVVERIVKSSSLGRIGRAEEVAGAVAFLASDQASYITGQCLVVDGGIV